MYKLNLIIKKIEHNNQIYKLNYLWIKNYILFLFVSKIIVYLTDKIIKKWYVQ